MIQQWALILTAVGSFVSAMAVCDKESMASNTEHTRNI